MHLTRPGTGRVVGRIGRLVRGSQRAAVMGEKEGVRIRVDESDAYVQGVVGVLYTAGAPLELRASHRATALTRLPGQVSGPAGGSGRVGGLGCHGYGWGP